MCTLAQVQALAGAVEHRWRALILLTASTRLRIGELSALRRAPFDFTAGTASGKSAVIDVIGQGRCYGPPKSSAGRRAVAIPPHMVGELEHRLATYAEPGARGLVLVEPNGGPYDLAIDVVDGQFPGAGLNVGYRSDRPLTDPTVASSGPGSRQTRAARSPRMRSTARGTVPCDRSRQ